MKICLFSMSIAVSATYLIWSELEDQSVRVLAPGLRRTERDRFEPRNLPNIFNSINYFELYDFAVLFHLLVLRTGHKPMGTSRVRGKGKLP